MRGREREGHHHSHATRATHNWLRGYTVVVVVVAVRTHSSLARGYAVVVAAVVVRTHSSCEGLVYTVVVVVVRTHSSLAEATSFRRRHGDGKAGGSEGEVRAGQLLEPDARRVGAELRCAGIHEQDLRHDG